MKSEVDDAKFFEDEKKPSVETEITWVNGRTRKRFVYNKDKFPNIRKQHGQNCDCDYCNPRNPLPFAPPIHTFEELVQMQIDKTWSLKPETNELGEEIDYVELKEPTEAEIEGVKKDCKCKCAPKDKGAKKCAPPFGADAIPMDESIVCWANAELDMAYQEELAVQQGLENFASVASTTDYQKDNDLKGLIVCYVNVGQDACMQGCFIKSPEQVIDQQKEDWEPILAGLPSDFERVYLPVRDGNSRIEVVSF